MSKISLDRAQRLADRPYQIEIECERGELSAEVPRYTASAREMPYCAAQGFTEAEARQEISSVLIDYILSLLARDIDVPEPEIKPCDNESDYSVHWLREDCFVYASKSFMEQFVAPHKPRRTFK